MPHIIIAVPETIESVTRPVALEATRYIMALTGIKTDVILYPGHSEKGKSSRSALEAEDDEVRFNAQELVTIDVDENHNELEIHATAIHQAEHLHVFRDSELGITVRPIYKNQEVKITVKYRADDEVQAGKWRSMMINRLTQGATVYQFSASYHYMFSEEIMYILREIHRLRELQGGYGQTWDQYWATHITPKIGEIGNQSGQIRRKVVQETQAGINGWFDFAVVPEKGSREGAGQAWEASFTFNFQYSKPTDYVFGYPTIIHNQVLSTKYRGDGAEVADYDPRSHARCAPLSVQFLRHFSAGVALPPLTMREGVGIPLWDEFIPRDIIRPSKRLYTQLCIKSMTLPRDLMSLRSVWLHKTEFKLDDDVWAFLLGEIPFINRPFRSLLHVQVYENFNPVDPHLIDVSSVGYVNLKRDLDTRCTYRVRLSVMYDLEALPPAALDRMRQHGRAVYKLLEYVFGAYEWPPLTGGWHIPKDKLDDIIDTVNPRHHPSVTYMMNTVSTLFVESHKELS